MSTMLWFSTNGLSLALSVKEKMYELALSLDGIVYTFINFLFKLFLVLARANIFSNDETYKLVGRIYQLVGVIMLFIFTYAMLRKIVSPDGKDKDSPSKIVFNIVKSIVLLAIVPSLFSYAFQIQEAILKQNTIGKVILGTSGNNTGATTPNEVIDKGGITMAQGVFEAFLFPTNGDENTEVMSGVTYKEMEEEVQQSGSFSVYQNSAGAVENGSLTYYWGMCLIGGAVVIYMLISYCISLGFRIVKLAFYEIMAPVCIIASILPSQKEMLSRWVKSTLSVFTEVFIRIAILYFITYVIQVVKNSAAAGQIFPTDLDFKLKALGFAAIIMGLVTFMKSAPDLISKLTGIESGNMSLGIRDQLAKGGFFTAGAIAGGAATGFVRNAGQIKNRFREAKQHYHAANTAPTKGKRIAGKASAIGAGISALGGVLGGAISGGIHGYSKDAKSLGDMKEGATKGAQAAVDAREKRAAKRQRYWADGHGMIGGTLGDLKDTVHDYFVDTSAKAKKDRELSDKLGGKNSDIKTKATDVVNKHRSSTALINQTDAASGTADFWSKDGTVNTERAALYTDLRNANGGALSLADIDELISQAEQGNLTVIPGADDVAKRKNLVHLRDMKVSLEKKAMSSVINAAAKSKATDTTIRINGSVVADLEGKDLSETRAAVEDFKVNWKLSGGQIIDSTNGAVVKPDLDSSSADVAKGIKSIADTAASNASESAKAYAAAEAKKAARKGDDKK